MTVKCVRIVKRFRYQSNTEITECRQYTPATQPAASAYHTIRMKPIQTNRIMNT